MGYIFYTKSWRDLMKSFIFGKRQVSSEPSQNFLRNSDGKNQMTLPSLVFASLTWTGLFERIPIRILEFRSKKQMYWTHREWSWTGFVESGPCVSTMSGFLQPFKGRCFDIYYVWLQFRSSQHLQSLLNCIRMCCYLVELFCDGFIKVVIYAVFLL